MNGLLSLFLAGATLVGPADDQAPKPKVDVSAQVYMPDGKATGASRRVDIGAEPVVLYIYTGKTLCEARTVSTEKPMVAGNGWKVTLVQNKGVEIVGLPSAVPKGTVQLKATWQRLWEGGRESAYAPKTSTINVSAGNPVPLDTIDSAARRMSGDYVARLKLWRSGEPVPAEFETDSIVFNYRTRIAELEQSKKSQMAQNGYGAAHPRITAIDADVASIKQQLNARVAALIADVVSRPATPSAVDGCAALSMNLQVEAAPTPDSAKVFELEFWLVHRDPAGKETTQRQVVRAGAMAAEFYFDDLKIDTDKGPVTVEVYGNTSPPAFYSDDGRIFFNMTVHRRYVTTAPTLGWKTKEGDSSYGGVRNVGEVVAYQLTPLPDDGGAFVGHRFSLRVRAKVLQ